MLWGRSNRIILGFRCLRSNVNSTHRHVGHIEFLNILDNFLLNENELDNSKSLIIVHIHEINEVNLNLGYIAGDELYTKIFFLLSRALREQDQAFPLENNKIAILLANIRNKGHSVLAAQKLIRLVNCPFVIKGEEILVHITLGISYLNSCRVDSIKFLQSAEIALKKALVNHTAYEITSPNNELMLEERSFEINKSLEKALDNDEYFLMYQPKLDIKNKIPVGLEALIRWENKKLGIISPEIFIPLLEKTRLINDVTNFALNTALRKQKELAESIIDIPISVNFSPTVIQLPKIEEFIFNAIEIWGKNSSSLIIEITESTLMNNSDLTIQALNKIRDLGISISIDDFGTGYSSLSYFKNIPANEIKIDKSFIQDISNNKDDYNIVHTIINLAHDFGHKVVAEGVENKETWEILDYLGCDVIQGYYVSKPLVFDEIVKWLSRDHAFIKSNVC